MAEDKLPKTEFDELANSLWLSMLYPLLNDLQTATAHQTTGDEADDQFWRRTSVRALVAFVEAQICVHKQYALLLHKHGTVQFTIGELALLHEIQFDLQNGKVREQQKFLRLADNYRLSVYAVTKATQSSHVLDVTGQQWQEFQEAINIRNRITHPKGPADVMISTAEDLTIRRVTVFAIGEMLILSVELHKLLQEENVTPEELTTAGHIADNFRSRS